MTEIIGTVVGINLEMNTEKASAETETFLHNMHNIKQYTACICTKITPEINT